VQRLKAIGPFTVAVSLLVLALTAVSCSPPTGSSSEATSPPRLWDVPTPVSVPQPNSNGAMVRANVHGTGVFATDGVRQLTGLQWKIELDDRRSVSAPVVQGSVVYFGGRDGTLYALDAADGTQKWTYQPLDKNRPVRGRRGR
jgi:hypothetical protein